MTRVIGFARERPAAEYVIFTDDDSHYGEYQKEGYELIFDELVEFDMPSSFPSERNLVVEM